MWVYRRRWHTSCSWSSDGFCLGKLTVCEMLPLRTMFRIPACQHQYLACCISAFSIFTAGLFIETKCVMAWLTGCYSSLLLTSSYLGKDNISTSEAQLLLNSQFFPVSLGKKKKIGSQTHILTICTDLVLSMVSDIQWNILGCSS